MDLVRCEIASSRKLFGEGLGNWMDNWRIEANRRQPLSPEPANDGQAIYIATVPGNLVAAQEPWIKSLILEIVCP